MSSPLPRDRSAVPGFLEPIARAAARRLAVRGRVEYGVDLRVGRGARVRSIHGLTIGDHVAIGRNCHVEVSGEIGDYTVLATNVLVVGRSDHAIDVPGTPVLLGEWVGNRAELASDRITIGRDVWIGAGAILLSGIAIGDGAVVGAGAVVARDVAPLAIVVGNPARQVSFRFEDDVERAKHLRWLRERED